MKKYKQVEKELLMKFREAGERDDIEQMQTMAETLSRYQNYQMCVDAYIEESVKQLALNTEIFDQIKGDLNLNKYQTTLKIGIRYLL